MSSNPSESSSLEGSVSDGIESTSVCMLMSNQHLKSNGTRKGVTHKGRADKRVAHNEYADKFDESVNSNKTCKYVLMLMFVLLVTAIAVILLEVALKFNILSMSPKIGADPLSVASTNAESISVPVTERVATTFPTQIEAKSTLNPPTDPTSVMPTSKTGQYNQTAPVNVAKQEECHFGTSWLCKNGNCISIDVFCDTVDNCGDNSDEYACDCGETGTEFFCKDGYCINQAWVCDGQDDCFEGEDELDCSI